MARRWFWLSWTLLALVQLAGCSQSVEVTPEPGSGAPRIPIALYRPSGAGPFPAVVLLHHCGGIRGVTNDWRQRLVGWGYVVAVPDSFTSRGFPKGVCGDGTKVTGATRALDAYAALHLLERQPDVLPGRIAAIGHSHGGVAVLSTVSESISMMARARSGVRSEFRAAIAFYPWCGDRTADTFGNWGTYRTVAPLLILVGEKDDWTPAGPCRAMAEAAEHAGQTIQHTVYAGARHAFDSFAPVTRVAEARRGRGATIGGDPAAREDSIRQTRAFLERYLRAAPQP